MYYVELVSPTYHNLQAKSSGITEQIDAYLIISAKIKIFYLKKLPA